ncbi:MAG: hypothetical protein AUJ56_05610 [Zetaproteobacteria bacterium CG1_02_49_23]|nr:MAG: hypothetical protein AUJ56_05610 [Zetaproteobacteria bacterium CG1_02_49_23]
MKPKNAQIAILGSICLALLIAQSAMAENQKIAAPSAIESGNATSGEESSPALASGDVKNGEHLFSTICAHCHQASANESNTGAPGLKDVLTRHDEAWINRWIESPETLIETDHKAMKLVKSSRFGLTMPTLPAMQEEQNRRDIIEYLRTL